MPVKRRRAKVRSIEVDDVAWAMMTNAPLPDPESQSTKWRAFILRHGIDNEKLEDVIGRPTLLALWQMHRDEILTNWSHANPGTRPTCWWRWDAPRWTAGERHQTRLAEPRQRFGGVGDPWCSDYHQGIPTGWMTADQFEYYNGRALDIHGQPIGTEYKDGHCTTAVPDPANPPLFESQAAYLDRHGLLLPGERKRLTAADFKPEKVAIK